MTKEDSLSLIRFICQDYFKMHKFSVNDIYEKYMESDSISDLVSYIKGIKIEQLGISENFKNYKPHLHKIFNPARKDIMYAFDNSHSICTRLNRYQDGRLSHTLYIHKSFTEVFFCNEKHDECILKFQTDHHFISFLSELNISPQEFIPNISRGILEDKFTKLTYSDLKNKLQLWRNQ